MDTRKTKTANKTQKRSVPVTTFSRRIIAEVADLRGLWSKSPILAVLVVIVILALGACYVFKKYQELQVPHSRALVQEVVNQTVRLDATPSTESPIARFDRAISEVAFKYDVTPQQIRDGIDLFVARVRSDPKSSLFDRALADFAQKRYGHAAENAELAAKETRKLRESGEAGVRALKGFEVEEWKLSGDSRMALHQTEAASEAYEKALELADKKSAPSTWADVASNLATCKSADGFTEESLKISREVFTLFTQFIGTKNAGFVRCLTSLSINYQSLNRLDEAEDFARQALSGSIELLGNENPDVAIRIMNLGTIRDQKGDVIGAENSFRSAIQILEHAKSYEPFAGHAYSNLGNLFLRNARTKDAAAAFSRAIDLERKQVPEKNLDVARDETNLGVALSEIGEYKKAEELLRDSDTQIHSKQEQF